MQAPVEMRTGSPRCHVFLFLAGSLRRRIVFSGCVISVWSEQIWTAKLQMATGGQQRGEENPAKLAVLRSSSPFLFPCTMVKIEFTGTASDFKRLFCYL